MSADPTLVEVSALLAAVKALLRRAARWDWRPNSQEATFLRAMADYLGPQLPPETLRSRTVTVAYLHTASASLESVFRRLMKDAQPYYPTRLA
jgi:hypothetical protein